MHASTSEDPTEARAPVTAPDSAISISSDRFGRPAEVRHPGGPPPTSLAVPIECRYLREARIQGWLDHPAIPSVYDLGHDDQGRPFFAMKRLSGITLDEILAARETETDADHDALLPRFTEQQLLRAFVEICLAIEFAHTRGVLHCDLKPANILLGEFGEVYVFDWGGARVLDEIVPASDATRPTLEQVANTDGVLGTPGYMSPDQLLIARMFTPLFIAPGVTALMLMAYAQHPTTRRRDLMGGGGITIAAVLGVWGAEAIGWISATTIVDGGVIQLRPPLDGVAQFPIVPALC